MNTAKCTERPLGKPQRKYAAGAESGARRGLRKRMPSGADNLEVVDHDHRPRQCAQHYRVAVHQVVVRFKPLLDGFADDLDADSIRGPQSPKRIFQSLSPPPSKSRSRR
ncbi:hypothetical protein C7T36_06635 [Rhodococcus sp. AD45-ID]|uniref:hypothetical protein n=1 Tax=Rhodococcus sp. (strain AD45) TaxID=103808 RepID=UPI0005D45B79|nr:hypothetical protein [Rhodococcus sp. AD45]PSR41911.1 hypothetical protein C7T36_06635 [Rhodococcus sp. AD45-ID]